MGSRLTSRNQPRIGIENMGLMKQFGIRIRNGGDDAVAAVQELLEDQAAEIERLREQLARLDAPVTHQPDVTT